MTLSGWTWIFVQASERPLLYIEMRVIWRLALSTRLLTGTSNGVPSKRLDRNAASVSFTDLGTPGIIFLVSNQKPII